MGAFDLEILQGKTLIRTYRWESLPIVYKPITAVSQAAPVVITSVAHGIPDGWRVGVIGVGGMVELNAANSPLRDSDYRKALVPTVDSVSFNEVVSADFTPYTSGGYLQYNTPVDLTAYSARMTIRDRVGGTSLAAYSSGTGEFAVNNTTKTITLTVAASITAAYAWRTGVYDIEMFTSGGVVFLLASGTVAIVNEVTT